MGNKIQPKLLIKFGQIVGHLYLPHDGTAAKQAVIYLKGGPSFADSGDSPLWSSARRKNIILFVPDYIGYCRSDGMFNFENCVKTIYESEKFLRGITKAVNCENEEESIQLECKNIVLVGSSWGGAIVPFLNKYTKSLIKSICMIKPVTDWNTQGKTRYKEENLNLTDYCIKNAWKNIYRGYIESEWPRIFAGNSLGYNPIDNPGLLKDNKVYIYHGLKDKTVNWRKSKRYFEVLKQNNIDVHLHLFRNEGHTSRLNTKAFSHFLRNYI